MKKLKKLLFIILCLAPMIVFASGEDTLSIGEALFMEAFVSIHMSVFVLFPLSKLLAKEGNEMKLFITLFVIRLVILLYFDFFVTTFIAIADFLAVFAGAFIIVPIVALITHKKNPLFSNSIVIKDQNGNIISNSTNQNETPTLTSETQKTNEPYVSPGQFDNIYLLDDQSFLQHYISQSFSKIGPEIDSRLIPAEILKRKKVFNVIFSILLTAFTSLLFFHFNLYIYIGGIIILIGFFILTRKYNLMSYIIKEIKSRPQEKISNILMNVKNNFSIDNSKSILVIGIIVAIVMPCLLFMNPRVMYEEMEDGNYSLRFYTLGIKQPSKVVIPDTYKGKPVVSIRGNVFANLTRVEEIVLPDTITEIRGQAFENSKSLKNVKLPNNLVSLGGGAFRNCTNLESIEFPDTTLEIGGEAFLDAYALKTVKLPNNLQEIRGNTFENCESLEKIDIPDSVRRIGGHAFRNCNSLSEVNISENSELIEIGSSAFRMCNNLYEIYLPKGISINERAFKESPTVLHYYGEYNDYQ